MKRLPFFASLLLMLIAISCSGDKKCDDTTGTFFCFNGVYHEISSKSTSNFTGSYPSVEITLTSNEGNNVYSINFSLWNTAFDVIPEEGSYDLVLNVPSNGGSRKVRPYATLVENGITSYWELDNTGSSSLHSFTLNVQPSGSSYILSGRYTGRLKNIDNSSDKKPVVVNFEDVSYTP
ncbi:MAG: hypothetical protein N2167_04495 [Flavobacteriales bacterium]|nr:hypothetical protein [Flavobacteriales bacterium]